MNLKKIELLIKDLTPSFIGLAGSIFSDSEEASTLVVDAVKEFAKDQDDFLSCFDVEFDCDGRKHLNEYFREKVYRHIVKLGFSRLLSKKDSDISHGIFEQFYSLDPVVRVMLHLKSSTNLSMEEIIKTIKPVTSDNKYQLLVRFNSGRDQLFNRDNDEKRFG